MKKKTKKKTKKLLSLILTVLMIVSVLPMNVIAAETSDGLVYEIANSKVIITGCTKDSSATTDYSVTIPETIGGYPVTKIADGAFENSLYLKQITIGSNVSEIGAEAFKACHTLTHITIPAGMTKMGSDAFLNCPSVEAVNYLGTPTQWSQINFVTIESNPVYTGNFKTLHINGSDIGAITIDEGITQINAYAFAHVTNLTSVDIASTVTSFGDRAFEGCTGITKTIMNVSHSKWAQHNFASATSNPTYYSKNLYKRATSDGTTTLNAATVFDLYHDNISKISSYAFINVEHVEKVALGYTENITDEVNSSTWVTESSTTRDEFHPITDIGAYAFSGCKSLTTLRSVLVTTVNTTYTNGLEPTSSSNAKYTDAYTTGMKNIGEYAFANSGITSFNYWNEDGSYYSLNTITTIGEYAFSNCLDLDTFSSGQGLTSIGQYAFSGSNSLTSVWLSDVLKVIPEGLFYNCDSLKNFTRFAGLTTIGAKAFYNTAIPSLVIPDSVTSIGELCFYDCSPLKSVTIGSGLTSLPNKLFQSSGITSIVIPNTVKTIGTDIFNDCNSLKTVTIGTGLSVIPERAFYESGVSTIEIPSNVKTISKNAFYSCKSLTSVTGCSNLETIDDSAFNDCTALTSFSYGSKLKTIGASAFYDCKVLTAITFPSTLTSIGNSAFSGCKAIKTVTIPNNVTYLGSSAFYECDTLESVILSTGLTTIKSSTFADCIRLNNIVIPEGVEKIEGGVFTGCSILKTITLPSTLKSMSSVINEDCELFELTRFNGTANQWAQISFSGSSANPTYYSKNLQFKNSSGVYEDVTSIEFTKGLQKINAYAFCNVESLEYVKFPSSLKSIGSNAFTGTPTLPEIAFVGTQEKWDSVSKSHADLRYDTITFIDVISDIEITSNIDELFTFGNKASTPELSFNTASTTTSNVKWLKYNDATEAWENYSADERFVPGKYRLTGTITVDTTGSSKNFEFPCNIYIDGNLATGVLEEPTSGTTTSCNFIYEKELKMDASFTCGESAYWYVDNSTKTLYIVGEGAINDYTSNDSAPWSSKYKNTIESIVVESGITNVSNYAFAELSKAKKITLPSTVTSIGESAFENCKLLGDITLPSNLKIIKNRAFYGCRALQSITIPASVETIQTTETFDKTGLYSIYVDSANQNYQNRNNDGVLYTKGLSTLVRYPVKKSGSISISPYVETIGEYAFSGNTGISTQYTPGSKIKTISAYAFKDCTNLQKVVILECELQNIDETAFVGCSSLYSIDEPLWYTSGGYNYTNSGSPYVYTENGVLYKGNTLVVYPANKYDESFVIPSNITAINGYAFYGAVNLKNVQISANVTTIPEHCFENCLNLEKVQIPAGLTSIGSYAFAGCNKLEEAFIPSTVTSIGDYAYANCTSIPAISLPVNAKELNSQNVFENWNKTQVVYHVFTDESQSLPTLTDTKWFNGSSAIRKVSYASMAGSNIYWYILNNYSDTDINLILDGSGTMYDYDASTCPLWESYRDTITSVMFVGGKITNIGAQALANHTAISELTIDEGVTHIGNNAFAGSNNIYTLNLPASIESFDGIFADECTSLQTINVSENSANYSSVGGYLCSKDGSTLIRVPEGAIYINIDNTVSIIGDNALNDITVTEFKLPFFINSLGSNVFSGWTDEQTVYVTGRTESEIPETFDENWRGNSNANFVFESTEAQKCGDEMYWRVTTDGTLQLFGTGYMYNRYSFDGGDYPWLSDTEIRDRIIKLEVADGELYLGDGICEGCTNLKTVTLSGDIDSLPSYIFQNCTSLETIVIPDNIEYLGTDCFKGCTSLSNVTLPAKARNLTSFEGCTSLKVLNIPATVEEFEYSNRYFKDSGIEEINIDENNPYITSYDGMIFNKELTKLIFVPCDKTDETITYPDTLTTIGSYAYADAVSLKYITLPETVTTLEFAAFQDSSFHTVIIPSSLNTSDYWAFKNTTSEQNILIVGKTQSDIAAISTWDESWHSGNATIIYDWAEQEQTKTAISQLEVSVPTLGIGYSAAEPYVYSTNGETVTTTNIKYTQDGEDMEIWDSFMYGKEYALTFRVYCQYDNLFDNNTTVLLSSDMWNIDSIKPSEDGTFIEITINGTCFYRVEYSNWDNNVTYTGPATIVSGDTLDFVLTPVEGYFIDDFSISVNGSDLIQNKGDFDYDSATGKVVVNIPIDGDVNIYASAYKPVDELNVTIYMPQIGTEDNDWNGDGFNDEIKPEFDNSDIWAYNLKYSGPNTESWNGVYSNGHTYKVEFIASEPWGEKFTDETQINIIGANCNILSFDCISTDELDIADDPAGGKVEGYFITAEIFEDHDDALDDDDECCDTCGYDFRNEVEFIDGVSVDHDNKVIFTDTEMIKDIESVLVDSSYFEEASPSYTTADASVYYYGTGSVFKVCLSNGTVMTYTFVVEGDLNGDSVCDVLDASAAALYSQGKGTSDLWQRYAAKGYASFVDEEITANDYSSVVNSALL